MSIRGAIAGLFGLGDGREIEALNASRSAERREARPSDLVERPLYGEAEAIRVLYQAAFLEPSPPKPPRPRKGRPVWVARHLHALSALLPSSAPAKA